MTIEKMRPRPGERNDYLITCNEAGCKASLDAKDRTFEQAVIFLKAKGWAVRKSYGSWIHTCAACMQGVGNGVGQSGGAGRVSRPGSRG